MVYTVSPESNDKLVIESSAHPSDDGTFVMMMMSDDAPLAVSSSSDTEDNHYSRTPEIPARRWKRKRVFDQKKSSPLDKALTILKSCASKPTLEDVPYACGIIVTNVFCKYPQHRHFNLFVGLIAYLLKVEEKEQNKIKNSVIYISLSYF